VALFLILLALGLSAYWFKIGPQQGFNPVGAGKLLPPSP